jgi:hydroxymethylpyrimidine kinase/phosphomethylpyrimidine kinase/thiamine-phosphate diphosphorylase
MAKSAPALPAVLLIGGLDPQGCAGILADSQTVSAHGCHPVPLLTCLTEQTSKGLTELGALTTEQFMNQYHAAVADFDIKTIKVGLVPNSELALHVLSIIKVLNVPVIWDPVLASSSGGISVSEDFQQYLLDHVLSHINLLTPNSIELAQLAQDKDVTKSTQHLLDNGLKSCLVKGGHSVGEWATDYFNDGEHAFYCYAEKQDKQVRGTGCVLAASIACNLALKHDMRDAIVLAKAYLTRGIRNAKPAGPYQLIAHSSLPFELPDIPKLTYTQHQIGQQFTFPSCPQRLGIYPVVDSSDWIKKLTQEGVKTIQLRIKQASKEQQHNEIKQAIASCDDSIAFFVNDYWQVAIEHNAYGVHLGQEDLDDANLAEIEQAGLRLGVSTHSYWELARALAVNPSYIALGPVFETTSKIMPWIPQGIERVEQWTWLLGDAYPLVAIGGIDYQRAKKLHKTGVGSVAMISAITKADDYKKATRDLLELWN